MNSTVARKSVPNAIRPWQILLLTIFSLLLATPKPANADTAVIVGGGYKLAGSQGQIELNVTWVQQVLKNAGLSVRTYFTDGTDSANDVYVIGSDTESLDYEALVRTFDDVDSALTRYHSNTVPDNLGNTNVETLLPTLSKVWSDNTSVPLLVYNGHGGPSSDKPDQVTLKLWNDTRLTARELHSELEKNNTDLKFVFTQCYSGGFHRIAYKESSDGLLLSDAKRCGFTSESPWRLAEGCSASIETSDYRDYTTYFFAALDGTTRDGDPLTGNADRDSDGVVSLREAHLYTLENAHSTDLSRSTSEDFLTSWQPAIDRWLPRRPELPDNEYTQLFGKLASRLNFENAEPSAESNPSAKQIRARLKSNTTNMDKLNNTVYQLNNTIRNSRRTLQQAAITRWPELQSPYSAAYEDLIEKGTLAEINDWLAEQPEYPPLRENQNKLKNLANSLLETERNATQMLKLLRLRKLAWLKSDIYSKGSAADRERYERLLACESEPLANPQTGRQGERGTSVAETSQ